MLLNSLKKLDITFELCNKNPADYVISTQNDAETKTVKLVLGKRGQSGEATDVHIINILALTLLNIFDISGKKLFEAIKDPIKGLETKKIIHRLYIELIVRYNSLTFAGVAYDTTAPVLQALSIMKKCGQVSKLHAVQLQVLFNRAKNRELSTENFLLLETHLSFHSLQVNLLEFLQPYLQHIEKEHLLLHACKEVGILPEGLFSLILSLGRSQSQVFSEILSHNLLSNEKEFHQKTQLAVSKWAQSSPTPSLDTLISWLQEVAWSSSSNSLDEKKKCRILCTYYKLSENWLEKRTLTASTITQNSPTVKKFEELIEASTILYHKVHGKKLLSMFRLLYLITLPFSSNYQSINKETITNGLFFSSLAVATQRNLPPVIDVKVVHFINHNKLASARTAFKTTLLNLRQDIVSSYKSERLLKWLQKPLTHKVKDIYANCYTQISSRDKEKHLTPQLFAQKLTSLVQKTNLAPQPIESFFTEETLKSLHITAMLDQLSIGSLDSKNRGLNRIKRKTGKIKKIEIGQSKQLISDEPQAPYIEEEKNSLHEDVPSSQLFQPKLEFFWRVRRWLILGNKVFLNDNAYANLQEEDYDEMLFRHTLFPEIDTRIDSIFSQFTWYTPKGKCLLFTAPAELDFRGKKRAGFIEYAFTIDVSENGREIRGACFHKYFAPKKESLSHQLAEKSFLEKDFVPLIEEEKGNWSVVGSQTRIEQREKSICFIDEKSHICLTVFT